MTKDSIIITERLVRSQISGLIMKIFFWQGTLQSTFLGLSEKELSGLGFRHFQQLESGR